MRKTLSAAAVIALSAVFALADSTTRGYPLPDRRDQTTTVRLVERINEALVAVDTDVGSVEDAVQSGTNGLAALDARVVAETNRAIEAEADLLGRCNGTAADLVAETNRAIEAEADLLGRCNDTAANLVTETNRAIQAEALLATAAQGIAATNAQALVTAGADPGHTHTVYASAAQGIAATNAQALVTSGANPGHTHSAYAAPLGSVAMSFANNDTTNGVVYMQGKNIAGANVGTQFLATVWVSKTALGTPDSSDLDVVSSFTCGTEIKDLGGDDMYMVASDNDGKISWAFITSGTPSTNYFYCQMGNAPLAVQQIVVPMP